MINKTTLRSIVKHMISCEPAEGCGFLVKDKTSKKTQEFVAVKNKINAEIAQSLVKQNTKAPSFLIDPEDYDKYSDEPYELLAIVHSHVYDAEPSEIVPSASDVVYQIATDVPWIIVAIVNGKYHDHLVFGEKYGK